MKTKTLLVIGALVSPLTLLAAAAPPATNCPVCPKTPLPGETWIALLPVLFFALILLVMIFKLRRGGVALSDLLAEKDPGTGATAAAGANSNPPQSASRFIAFFTGLTALIIGVCLCAFFMYTYFRDGKMVDLSNLTTVIWGLGIGVLPYGFNKGASALKQPGQ